MQDSSASKMDQQSCPGYYQSIRGIRWEATVEAGFLGIGQGFRYDDIYDDIYLSIIQ
jgi:hypothetical protein